MDTYGCLYNSSFDPSYPSRNLIDCNDDDGGDRQFRIIAPLTSESVYVLIATTYSSGVVGRFSVFAYGYSPVQLIAFTPSTTRSTTPRSELIDVFSLHSHRAAMIKLILFHFPGPFNKWSQALSRE
jgi:hypothetical protein